MSDFAEAEAGVRQLHARYTDAVWRKDAGAFGDCCAEDCQWRISGQVLIGREAIVRQISGIFPQFRRILLTFRTPVLEITGDGAASGRTYVTEQSVKADGTAFAAIGTYYERFVREGDKWRFAWRLFQTEYAGPPDFSAPFLDNPDYGPPPAMPPLDAPTFDRTGIQTRAAAAAQGAAGAR